ncbi:MAG: protocatechuate 3,4-dioxygenase [Myxococcota bacterium]
MHDQDELDPTRRTILRGLGAGLLVGGCTDPDGEADGGESTATGSTGEMESSGNADESSSGSTGGGGSGENSSSTAAEDDTSSTGNPVDCDPADAWAAGGTAAMTAQDCYPDPFANGVDSCMLLCQTTAGPCTADTVDRQDVSEGYAGLPVRLALKIVNADDCLPVEGAYVEIWHTQRAGIYSGMTPGGNVCNLGDQSAEAELYFRGSRTTDAEGRVDFDTCYPGWYGGRAIHIHFRVMVDGNDHLVSQLFFDDALNDEICTTHPDYAEFGAPNTLNTTDGVIGDVADLSPYLLETARMADGAMLASKVVAIRSSVDEPLCSA